MFGSTSRSSGSASPSVRPSRRTRRSSSVANEYEVFEAGTKRDADRVASTVLFDEDAHSRHQFTYGALFHRAACVVVQLAGVIGGRLPAPAGSARPDAAAVRRVADGVEAAFCAGARSGSHV
jgi:hypothetical protein